MTRVVALGGGHGLASSLTAVRTYASEVTAIVSVADDGGSSGRLREALGIAAPGDLRRCLVALGNDASVWTRVFEHRFAAGELAGHAVGNLVIAGLAATLGDFNAALEEAGRLVGAVGRVLPATEVPVTLRAESATGPVEGQVAVASAGRIAAVSIDPPDAAPPKAALDAITDADQVIIGPGSLFTSVLAVIAVPALREVLARTTAQKVYVANLRQQHPETSGFDVAAHVHALMAHGLEPDVVLGDPLGLPQGDVPVEYVERSIARPSGLAHDTARLAAALQELLV